MHVENTRQVGISHGGHADTHLLYTIRMYT